MSGAVFETPPQVAVMEYLVLVRTGLVLNETAGDGVALPDGITTSGGGGKLGLLVAKVTRAPQAGADQVSAGRRFTRRPPRAERGAIANDLSARVGVVTRTWAGAESPFGPVARTW